jgi:phospholipase C
MKLSARLLMLVTLTLALGAMASAQCSLSATNKTIHICAPTSGSTVTSPVAFSASANDTSSRVTSMAIYLDSAKVFTVASNQLSTSLTIPSGTHNATIKAWDATGAVFSAATSFTVGTGGGGGGGATCTLSTVNPSVTVCTPANNATVSSPVHVNAGSTDSLKVTTMQVYLDGTKVYQNSLNFIDTDIPVSNGVHKLTIKGWDTSGRSFSQAVYVSVGSGTVTPSVTITANPSSISPGGSSTLTVVANNATNVVVYDGNTGQDFPLSSTGGTLSVSPTITTQYTAVAKSSSGDLAQATATVTISQATGDMSSVKHIIFYTHENRSFDSYFGFLNPYREAKGWTTSSDGKVYTVDGLEDKWTNITNQTDEGQTIGMFHTSSSCIDDLTSAWLESFGMVDRYNFSTTRPIKMDGFVHIAENVAKNHIGAGTFNDTIGRRAMAFYKDVAPDGTPQLNYYYWMASQFAISDRWFSPIASKTIPNRLATMTGGTTLGYTHDPQNDDATGQLSVMTIFQLLDQHGISWKIYYESKNGDGTPTTEFSRFSYSGKYIKRNADGSLFIDATHIAPISQYFTDVQNGTLPSFAYINKSDGTDEHPGSGTSILAGQQQTAKIINALMYSPSWKDSVFFYSYDEPGGPYDHVPPVPGRTNDRTAAALKPLEEDVSGIAVNPDGFKPCLPTTPGVYNNHCDLRPTDPGAKSTDAAAVNGFAAQIGFRVPNIIVSPFAKPHYVGHRAMDHTAVIRFVERRFGLPAMTNRDAAQPDLFDFFDFANPPWLTPPPQNTLPVPPSVGSTCHPDSMD